MLLFYLKIFLKRTWKESIIILAIFETIMLWLHFFTSFGNVISLFSKCIIIAPCITIGLWILSAIKNLTDSNNKMFNS